jgi:hypothetical protein
MPQPIIAIDRNNKQENYRKSNEFFNLRQFIQRPDCLKEIDCYSYSCRIAYINQSKKIYQPAMSDKLSRLPMCWQVRIKIRLAMGRMGTFSRLL